MLSLVLLPAALVVGVAAAATTTRCFITDDFYCGKLLGHVDENLVVWRNDGQNLHSVTQNRGRTNLGLFDSGPLSPGEEFSFEFNYVGSYGYRDTFSGAESVARFIPRITVNGREVHLILGAKPLPEGFVLDVEQKLLGTHSWERVVDGTTETEATVTEPEAGTYIIRARLRRTVANRASGWSPGVRVMVS